MSCKPLKQAITSHAHFQADAAQRGHCWLEPEDSYCSKEIRSHRSVPCGSTLFLADRLVAWSC